MIPLVVAVCGLAWSVAARADEAPPPPVAEPEPAPVVEPEPALAPDPPAEPAVTPLVLPQPIPPVISIAPPPPPPSLPPRTLTGPLAGALTALLPLTVGGMLWAQDGRPDLQRAGARVMLTGFAAAPWVAQGVSGRWGRALGYGLVSLAASTTAIVAMDRVDVFDPAILNGRRLPFAAGLTVAFFAAAAGVIDSFVMASPPAAEGGDWR